MGKWTQRLNNALAGKPFEHEPAQPPSLGHTSHISVMDDAGLAVSITTSAGESGGYLVANTGICLNNILGELDLNPNGWHQHPPGSRLSSMMSPAIVLKNGRPVMSVGSAGSNRIRSAILQTISRFVDFDMDPDKAINAPRIHYEEGILQIEAGFSGETIEYLKDAGFAVNVWDETSLFFGGAQAVVQQNNSLNGAADHRRNGAVAE